MKLNLLVLGDLLIDLHTYGSITRVSPEDPTIKVVKVEGYKHSLGGAGVVAEWCKAFGSTVWLATMLPRLLHSHEADLLGDMACGPSLFIDRALPLKQRLILEGRPELARIDFESYYSPSLEEVALWQTRLAGIPENMAAILICDYAKGACHPLVTTAVIKAARSAGVPVIVDPPRGESWDRYYGASGIKANREEAEQLVGHSINHAEAFCSALDTIIGRFGLEWALITAGMNGIYAMQRTGRFWRQPTIAGDPKDVTGAGDAVAATLGFLLGHRVEFDVALRFAAAAGTLSTRQVGTRPIAMSEIRELANEPSMASR